MSGVEVVNDWPVPGRTTHSVSVTDDGETVARFYGDHARQEAEVYAAILRGDLLAVQRRWGDGAVQVPHRSRGENRPPAVRVPTEFEAEWGEA